MSTTRLATRYAKSILDLAVEKGRLEEIMKDMRILNAATDGNRDFYMMLKSPLVNGDKKMEVVLLIFKGQLTDITENFIRILMRKNRESYLPEIIDAFIAQYNSYMHITPVKMTTAAPISKAMMEEVMHTLKTMAKLDNIELTTQIDENIIGGYILQYEDKLIDTSVARGLSIMKKEFENNDYVKKY